MITVLSFFDFLVVITNHPILILRLVWWLQEKNGLLDMMDIYEHFSNVFIGFSLIALLVMSLERYLGTYYPFFHRTSLTRRQLLTLIAVLCLFPITLAIISANDLVISFPKALIIFLVAVFPPFVFFNYKLFMIRRKVRCENSTSSTSSMSPVNLKNISTCLLAVGFLLLMYIPAFISIAFNFTKKLTSENKRAPIFFASTIANANSTFNCLIFFWKNNVLRKEGKKAFKVLFSC